MTDLPYPVQLNIAADYQASHTPVRYTTDEPIIYPAAKVALYDARQRPITKKHRRSLTRIARRSNYINALTERWQWHRQTFDTIDWCLFSSIKPTTTTTNSIPKQTWVKLCNRLLPIAYRQHRDNPTRPRKCPTCDCPLETDLHLYHCEAPSRLRWKNQLQQKLLKHLESRDTDPGILNVLVEGILRACRNQDLYEITADDHVKEAWSEQLQIGILNLFCGHMSKRWKHLQQQYLVSIKKATKKNTGTTWARSLLLLLRQQWLILWKSRNDDQHGNDIISQQEIAKNECLKEIRAVQSLRPTIPPSERALFDQKISEANSQSTLPQLESWLDVFKPMFTQWSQDYIQRSTTGMRSITTYFHRQPRFHTSSTQQQIPSQDHPIDTEHTLDKYPP